MSHKHSQQPVGRVTGLKPVTPVIILILSLLTFNLHQVHNASISSINPGARIEDLTLSSDLPGCHGN